MLISDSPHLFSAVLRPAQAREQSRAPSYMRIWSAGRYERRETGRRHFSAFAFFWFSDDDGSFLCCMTYLGTLSCVLFWERRGCAPIMSDDFLHCSSKVPFPLKLARVLTVQYCTNSGLSRGLHHTAPRRCDAMRYNIIDRGRRLSRPSICTSSSLEKRTTIREGASQV